MTAKEKIELIFNKLAGYLKSVLPQANPYDKNELLYGIFASFASGINDLDVKIDNIKTQFFTATATGEDLEKKGLEFGIVKNAATRSSGNVSFAGIENTIIPNEAELTDQSGNLYITTSSSGVAEYIKSVDLDANNGIVLVEFSENHLLVNGFSITISGATESKLNGTFDFFVLDAQNGYYFITDTVLDTTDTGDATYLLADTPVESIEYGSDQNRLGGDVISLTNGIAGINIDGGVQQSGIGKGSDNESEEPFRSRLQIKQSNPVTNFNVANIRNQALEIGYVNNIFIDRATNGLISQIGYVTCYPVKTDFTPLLQVELDEVQNKIFEIASAINTIDNIVVNNPTKITNNYDFASISPDTPTMREAIEANLAEFYKTLETNQSITEITYRRVIASTIDPANLDKILDFTLNSPSGDITINKGELAVLGTVSFS